MAGLDSNTALLMHFDALPFTDSSTNNNKGDATNSNTTIDTTTKKFGDSSASFNGSNSLLQYSDSADWDFTTTEDFIVDFWIKLGGHSGTEFIFSRYTTAANLFYIQHRDNGDASDGLQTQSIASSTTVIAEVNGGEISDTDWHHCAYCYIQGEVGIYKDGTQVAYGTQTGNVTMAEDIVIGQRNGGAAPLLAHIDELRVQRSNYFSAAPNAGLTDTITVPTEAYSVGGGGGSAGIKPRTSFSTGFNI